MAGIDPANAKKGFDRSINLLNKIVEKNQMEKRGIKGKIKDLFSLKNYNSKQVIEIINLAIKCYVNMNPEQQKDVSALMQNFKIKLDNYSKDHKLDKKVQNKIKDIYKNIFPDQVESNAPQKEVENTTFIDNKMKFKIFLFNESKKLAVKPYDFEKGKKLLSELLSSIQLKNVNLKPMGTEWQQLNKLEDKLNAYRHNLNKLNKVLDTADFALVLSKLYRDIFDKLTETKETINEVLEKLVDSPIPTSRVDFLYILKADDSERLANNIMEKFTDEQKMNLVKALLKKEVEISTKDSALFFRQDNITTKLVTKMLTKELGEEFDKNIDELVKMHCDMKLNDDIEEVKNRCKNNMDPQIQEQISPEQRKQLVNALSGFMDELSKVIEDCSTPLFKEIITEVSKANEPKFAVKSLYLRVISAKITTSAVKNNVGTLVPKTLLTIANEATDFSKEPHMEFIFKKDDKDRKMIYDKIMSSVNF